MKRIFCIILSLLLCFNLTIISTATSTESNVVSSNNEKVETLNEESNKITNEIMLMNFIGVRLEEIIRTESTVLLKDTIDLIQKGGIKFTTIDKKTQSYLQSLFKSTTDWKLEEMDRNRLLYNYSQRESRAMSEALKPGVMALLTTVIASAATKDPLTAVLSIGSLVADGVSSYYGSIEQSEQDYDEGNFKLGKERLKTIEGIKKDFFDYCNDMVRDNNIPENMIVYQTKAEKYGENLLESNLASRLKYFEDNVNLFDGLPSIHLELAKCYFEKGEYKKCVDEIDKYNESNINIFNNDETLINTFPLAFAAASNYMSNYEYEAYVVKNMKYAEKLENLLLNGDIKNMLPMFRYKNILVYMDLYGKTNKKEYLDKAYDKCKTNIIPLVREQRKLKEQDSLAINELLINNLEALKATAKKKNISKDEKELLDNILYGNSYLFPTVLLRECYSFGDRNAEWNNEIDEISKGRLEVTNDSPDAYMYAVTKKGDYSYYFVYLSYGGTKDSEVIINFKDKNGTTYTKTLLYQNYYNEEGGYFEYKLKDFDDIIDFDDETIFDIELIPKRNIECRTLKYRLKCIKMPLGWPEINEKKTLDEITSLLDNLGFNKDNIQTLKDKGLFEPDDGQIKSIYYTDYFHRPWSEKEKKWKTKQYYSFFKDNLLSTNQNFWIKYR